MDGRFERCMTLPLEALDFELSPSRSAKDASGALGRMVARTRDALEDPDLTVRRDLSYGDRPEQRLDVFRPRDAGEEPLPAVVFLHGGFWQEGDKSVSGFAAQTFAALGWAWVSVGYTLTPQISLTGLTQQIHAAVRWVSDRAGELGIDPDRIVLAGHSAGGHLAASVVADIFDTGIDKRIAGAVLVSGVFDLAPIARSYVNDLARISAAEVEALSPLRRAPASGMPVHVLIGADEPQAFHDQSEVLCDLWQAQGALLTRQNAQGRDHFDVLDELIDPRAPSVRALLAMARRSETSGQA